MVKSRKAYFLVQGGVAFVCLAIVWFGFVADSRIDGWNTALPDKGSAVRLGAELLEQRYPGIGEAFAFDAIKDETDWSNAGLGEVMEEYRTWQVYTVWKDKRTDLHGGGAYVVLRVKDGSVVRYGVND